MMGADPSCLPMPGQPESWLYFLLGQAVVASVLLVRVGDGGSGSELSFSLKAEPALRICLHWDCVSLTSTSVAQPDKAEPCRPPSSFCRVLAGTSHPRRTCSHARPAGRALAARTRG
eukprot:353707-Chlamydomonas_euryale.AAC.16